MTKIHWMKAPRTMWAGEHKMWERSDQIGNEGRKSEEKITTSAWRKKASKSVKRREKWMIFCVCSQALSKFWYFEAISDNLLRPLFSSYQEVIPSKIVLCSVFEVIENKGVKTGNLNEDLATFSFGAINNRMQNTKTGFQLNFNF